MPCLFCLQRGRLLTREQAEADKGRAAEIIEGAVFDKNRLFGSPLRIVSPRVITVFAAAFPGVVPDVNATRPGFHSELAMVDHAPGPTKKYQRPLIELVEFNMIDSHIWSGANSSYGNSGQAPFINCASC